MRDWEGQFTVRYLRVSEKKKIITTREKKKKERKTILKHPNIYDCFFLFALMINTAATQS